MEDVLRQTSLKGVIEGGRYACCLVLQVNIGFEWKADGVPVRISNARLSLKGVIEIEGVPRQISLEGVIEKPP